MRILVANRGEIARRIIRTAHRLGHETVAAHADPDASAPFVAEATRAVRLGPADLGESYLSSEALLEAASRTGATAVHPGYGFLSENAAFARAVESAGLVWIGPHPGAIELMGSKIEARRRAAEAGVPTIAGFDSSQDPTELVAAAERIGYPVLVKASAGGGGKGIRVARAPSELRTALAEAAAESMRSFGDDAVIVERLVEQPRHVEVQVVGDRHGGVIELGTRECSLQRRYQKLLEEAPAPNLADATRRGLRESAVALARSIGYDSAGTVEFIVDAESGEHFFLEMNTRLQVEHPVTEAVTGVDLVELMIRAAAGEPVASTGEPVTLRGHAFEVRINAEDPEAGFVPRTGTVSHLVVPDGVRWDSGIEIGTTVTPFYDPLLAKLVVSAPDRDTARRSTTAALEQLIVGGVITNAGFQRRLLDQEPVVQGRATSRFVDEMVDLSPSDGSSADRVRRAAESAALAWVSVRDRARPCGPWGSLASFRLTPRRPSRFVALADLDREVHEIVLDPRTVASVDAGSMVVDEHGRAIGVLRSVAQATGPVPVSVDPLRGSIAVAVEGETHTFSVLTRSEHWAPAAAVGHGHAGAIVAPFPAVVAEIAVAPGDDVAAGSVVVVIEAMKMLHSLTATGPGSVAAVRVGVGDQIETGEVLVTFGADSGPTIGEDDPTYPGDQT